MKLTKEYAVKEINLHLLPEFIEKVKSSIPSSMLVETDGTELELDQHFLLQSASEVASTRNPQEFRDILRTMKEPSLSVVARVDCFNKNPRFRSIESRPPAFFFDSDKDSIRVSMARNTADSITALFRALEETFDLVTVKPSLGTERQVAKRRTVFVAHSFDERGKSYAYEVIKLLTLLGFQVATGEGYSPEGVSTKVRKRLMGQEVVIAVLSRKEDSTWLTQETAGAAFTNKPLILLIEEGVAFKPGVLGDLECIRFSEGQISAAFVPLLEGLQELGYRVG